MSKKDFIALADILRPVLIPARATVDRQELLDRIVEFCRAQNPDFKEDRWRDYLAGKCGPNGGKLK